MPRLSKIGAAALAAFGWTSGVSTVSVSYLVVAGGAAGGSNYAGGGGGAGGYLAGTTSLDPTQSYAVTVGAGGAPTSGTGANGSNSVFNAITSIGGGGGGKGENTTAASSGGSGGGGGGGNPIGGNTGAAGTAGQGNNGGDGVNTSWYGGGGGGGASAVGGNGAGGSTQPTAIGGNGGAGSASSITGSSVTRAGGGGGAAFGTAGTGGAGGGGAGSISGVGTSGTANLGGGGGGGGGAAGNGGQGGSGVVIISYPSPQKFGGGIVTVSGSNTIHTFQTSGTLSPLSSVTASYLIVAGGGGGGTSGGGGGGGGGMQTVAGLTIDTNSIYTVTVGGGGAAATNGVNSSFSLVSTASVGGGAGGISGNGSDGGSGGGGGANGSGTTSGGTGTTSQGNAGGTGAGVAANRGAGGGGGASAVGGNGTGSSGGIGGAGGNGLASSITGSSVTYAGGGGGNTQFAAGTASGGTGGGGTGGNSNSLIQATNGTANLGGGGGGGEYNSYGGVGGSGVVIISYAGSTQQMAGGTVTISGGNVIHTFTSSGYLTPLKLVNNSLRFRASASAYLSRTGRTATDAQKATYSFWFKRGTLTTGQWLFTGGTTVTLVGFNGSSDSFSVLGSDISGEGNITTAVFRDPAAWYHFVVVIDTTQTTTADRAKIYVNGVQQTVTVSNGGIGLGSNWGFNTAGSLAIGRYNPVPGSYFDGYMTDINFIDGQALTPNSFGTFNQYGVWQPITYGGSYGTNGFYLKFNDATSTTTLGLDSSPQGNNWTTNNISLTAGTTYDSMTDVPTLTSTTAANYCVLNPLDKATSFNVTGGNLNFAPANTSDLYSCRSTIQIPSTGKWIWEVTNTNSAYMITAGLLNGSTPTTGQQTVSCAGMTVGSIGTFFSTTQWMNTTTSWSVTNIGNGDTLVIAYDADAGKIWFGRVASGGSTVTFYNTSGTADPSTGTDPRASGIVAGGWFAGFGTYFTPSGASANFGQRPFAFTNIPTGFLALNTFNL